MQIAIMISKKEKIVVEKGSYFLSLKYGDHAATLLLYFIFWGARAEDRTRGCLTAARRATCRLRRHPVGYVATLVGYVATLSRLRRHPK